MPVHLLASITALLAQSETEPPRLRPPEAHYQPFEAVDHVALVEVDEVHGPDPITRHRLTRSGTWLRIGDEVSSTYSDFASATTISFRLDEQGQYSHLSISRHRSTDTYNLFRRVRTGARDRALGEACVVWNTIRVGEREGEGGGVNWLSCETEDGIELWSRAESARDGTVLRSSRTLEFQRRRVRDVAVRPPAGLLRWTYWRDLGPPVAPEPAPVGQPAQFEVRLAATGDRGREAERLLRRRGDWRFEQSTQQDGTRHLALDNGAIALHYQSESDGRPVSLNIHRKPPSQSAAEFRIVPVEPSRSERVLGEQCVWSLPGSSGGIIIISGSHQECVTVDSLPVRVERHHRVWWADLTAVEISREAPPMDALMPPAEAFDWTLWDVDPAA